MSSFATFGASLVLLSGLAIGGTASAQMDATASSQTEAPPPPQEHGPRKGGMEHRMAMLQQELNLSAEQASSVRLLLETEHTQMDALHANEALTPDQRHTQMMAVRQELNTKMHALLTSEQAAKYDAMQARMRQHGPGPEGPPPGSSPATGPGGV